VSPPAGATGAAVVVVSSTLGIIVLRKGSMVSFSRILNVSPGTGFASYVLNGPRIPIDVLFTLSSLSCCRVSRRACKPCLIRSSREAIYDNHVGVQKKEQFGLHTICKTFIMLFEIGFRALASGTDRHGIVFIRISGRLELVQMGSIFVLSND